MIAIPLPAPVSASRRNEKPFVASIIVTSDTCCEDQSKDVSGVYILDQLKNKPELFSQVTKRYVKDDKELIVECLKRSFEEDDPALVITIGGTGLCPRDVTPDAVGPLFDRYCAGIVAAMNMISLRYEPHAALSRLSAGIVGECLVVNFPGSLKACKDCWSCLDSFIGHALEQVRFNAQAYKDTHLKLNASTAKSEVMKLDKKAPAREVLRPIVPLAGDQVGPSSMKQENLPTLTHKKYQIRRSASPDGYSIQSASSRMIAQRFPRLSARDVQESRAEQQSINGDSIRGRPTSLNKKPFYNKKKYTSLDNLSHKQSTYKPEPGRTVPKVPMELPSIKVPKTHSDYPMIEFGQAHEVLGSHSGELLFGQEVILLNSFESAFKLNGRVLTENMRSKTIVPPHAVSTMDGYVLNIPKSLRKVAGSITQLPPAQIVEDLTEFKKLQVHPQESQSFFCYRINTGGKLPDKNFAVVPYEKTSKPTMKPPFMVTIFEAKLGQYQRIEGSDIGLSDELQRGTVIGPVEMSLIVSMGLKQVSVFRQPRIGVLSTGDELADFFAGQSVGANQVADTNGPLLTSAFRLRGYYSFNHGIVRDNPSELLNAITHALKRSDVLLVTGGASMGSKDHVKDVLKYMGAKIHFGRVNIKPGKPVAFASLMSDGRKKFIFSLPGNPVSAYVTSMLLVLPFIEHGTKNHFNREGTLTLDCVGEFINVIVSKIIGEPYEFDGRLEFVRASLISKGPEYKASVSMQQQSSRLLSLKDYECLIMIDPNLKGEKFVLDKSYPALKINRPL